MMMMGRRRSSSCSKASARDKRSSSSNVRFDEFGFAFCKRRERNLHHRCHDYSYPQPNVVKVKELCELLSYWNGSSFICRNQIERFIRLGIPPALRGRVWKCLLDIKTVQVASDFSYQVCLSDIRKPLVDLGVSEYSIISAITTLGERENELGLAPGSALSIDVALFRQIALDLQRSFPTHRSLMGDTPESIEGQARLFRVLTAYTKYNPQIGYSQGMSYIAAVLLMLLSEEEAFWALVALLDKPKFLSELFDSSLKKIQHQPLVFQQLLKHRMPQLFHHLEKLGVSSMHFIIQWFLTLFTSLPCWDTVLAIWDLCLLHGMGVVFRCGLTILQLLEPRLMSMTDEASVLSVLLHVPVDVAQYHVLVPALWSTEVQEWEISCMNRLILEKTDEGHNTAESGPDDPVSLSREEQKEQRPHEETKGASGNGPAAHLQEAVGSGGRNVFARMLKAAQRCLADTTKQSTTKRRKSRRRQSQNTSVPKMGPLQDGDRVAIEESSPKPLRRLRSVPAGRVAHGRSSFQSTRFRSLLHRTHRGTAQCLNSPVSNSPCSNPARK